jgi:thioredoxin 1
MARRLSEVDFEEAVEGAHLALVEFYTDSCIPCKQMSPILGDIEDDYEGRVAVFKVNANFDGELAERFEVMASPTLVLFKEGQEIDRQTGIVKKPALAQWLDEALEA